MLIKEYYRISELKERFDISVEDIKYLVETSKVELVFNIENQQYIYGGWLKDKGFVGFGIFNYRGLVKLTGQEQFELLVKSHKKFKSFKIVNKQNISNIKNGYPYETPTPNAFIYAWEPKTINNIKWDYIPAKLFHDEKEHHLRSVGKMFTNAIAMFDKAPDLKPKEDILSRVPQKGFYHDGIQLEFSDSCILHSDLVKLGIIKPELTSHDSDLSEKVNRPIDLLLTKLIKQFPNDKPAKIWDKLIEDISLEPRLLDTDEILDEVGEDTLFWFDNQAEIKQMKKKSFYNLISKLKNI